MSTSPITNNSVTYPELHTETYESFRQQYEEYVSTFENISSSDSYKTNVSYLDNIKQKLEELLEELDKVVEDGYDKEVVEEAMQALGALLKGSSTMMSLEVRLECLEKLIEAMSKNRLSKENYDNILSKLNDPDNDYSKEDFDQDYDTACKNYYKELIEKRFAETIKLSGDETADKLQKIYYKALIAERFPTKSLNGNETADELQKIYLDASEEEINGEVNQNKAQLDEANAKANTTVASLSLKVIQANHQFKSIELENISDQKKEQDAQKNPMIKKLKNEGVWAENNAIDRHLEMIEEERINELRNQNRK